MMAALMIENIFLELELTFEPELMKSAVCINII